MEKKQRIAILRQIVNQLKPKYRDLVKLRYFKELSYDEIADTLNIPLGTVKAQLHIIKYPNISVFPLNFL